jgi:hypothetical protein
MLASGRGVSYLTESVVYRCGDNVSQKGVSRGASSPLSIIVRARVCSTLISFNFFVAAARCTSATASFSNAASCIHTYHSAKSARPVGEYTSAQDSPGRIYSSFAVSELLCARNVVLIMKSRAVFLGRRKFKLNSLTK